MIENSSRQRRVAAVIVFLSVAVGAVLRLSGLDARSVSHPEMYVPGIHLPEGMAEPAERLTARRILTGTFSSDTHPPGYYLFMLPWTRVMGTSLSAMRLPSALLGIACIPMVYWLGVLAGLPLAGALAAALVAVSGYAVFWSQVARMFTLDCFLGLAATIMLLLIVQTSRYRAVLITGYVVLILAGVVTHVFFWTLFASHMIWAFANARNRRELPDVCRAQLLAMVLGSPLLAFGAYQSSNTVAFLSRDALLYLAEFAQFAFVLPTDRSGFFPSAVPFTGTALSWAARALILLLGGFLLVNGVRHLRSTPNKPMFAERSSGRKLWRLAWIAAGILGTVAIGLFLFMARQLQADQLHDAIRRTQILIALPLVLTFLALILDRTWGRLSRPGRWIRWMAGERRLLVLLAIGPFAMLAAISQFRPFLNQRGLLFATPYLLLAASAGLVSIRRKVWIALALPVLVATCAASLVFYRGMMVDPADYNQFATTLRIEIQPSDLVFIPKAWNQTPILYYLQADRYRLVGRDFALACGQDPAARVWVVLLYEAEPTAEMQHALAGYTPVRTVTAPHAKALLYQRPTIMADRR